MHNYQRIWKQDRRFLGAPRAPAPFVKNVKKGSGYASTGSVGGGASGPQPANAPKLIRIGPGARRQLQSRNPSAQSSARNAIEHEFARVYQDPSGTGSSASAGSGVANAVANRLAHFRNTGKGNPRRYNRKHLPYFGQNPRSITWPSS